MREYSFKHSSRTYLDVYNALKKKYPKLPDWLFVEMSGLFDFQSELLNNIANDILSPVTKESAYHFANRCDYSPIEADGAIASITINLTGAMVKTLTAGYQVGGISSQTGNMVLYELIANASSGGTDTIIADFKQKQSFTNISLGNISNVKEYYEVPVSDYVKILADTFSLEVASIPWTKVDNFDNSISTDKHYKLIFQSNGKVVIQFGDGTRGLLPSNSDTVVASFSITDGILGQMSANEININVGGDGDISSVTNSADSSGGNASESIKSIIRNSKANIRSKNIVWSIEDLEIQARQASSSVIKALGVGDLGSASIYIIPSGGGNPSAGLKTTVETYVESKTQFGLMPITILNPNYVSTNISATISIRTGYVQSTVEDLTEFAMTLVSCAYDNQVIEYYQDFGIDKCRTDIINILWAWAFTSSENDALEFIIEKWVELLGTREYRGFGQSLEVGNIWIMGDSLYAYGVDTFSLTAPVTNVTVTNTQIINTNVVTITV